MTLRDTIDAIRAGKVATRTRTELLELCDAAERTLPQHEQRMPPPNGYQHPVGKR